MTKLIYHYVETISFFRIPGRGRNCFLFPGWGGERENWVSTYLRSTTTWTGSACDQTMRARVEMQHNNTPVIIIKNKKPK